MGWRNRPTFKDYWPKDVDVIMFVDESGDSHLKSIKKNIKNGKEVQSNNRYFTITGCIIRKENFLNAGNEIIKIKEKYWENGLFNYKGKLKRVCFHSYEIRGNKDPFNSKIINRNEFLEDISRYMKNIKIDIFSATLDKELHCRRYNTPDNPYNLCMNFIMERLVKYYLTNNEKAAIILESRGRGEDKALLTHIKGIIDNGTEYVNKSYFKKIKGVYFNPKWCKSQDEKKSYFGLEIADLIAYPIHKYTTRDKKDLAFECIEDKIYGYPNYEGKRIKIFPKSKKAVK